MATEDRGGRTVLILVVVIALLAVVAYALGLFNIDTSGRLKAPNVAVDVKGGEVPKVQVETADVDVGTKDTTIKVPEVDVKTGEAKLTVPDVNIKPAKDDGSANK